jgi:hypothetical protein
VLKLSELDMLIEGLQNLYASVRFRPAPPDFLAVIPSLLNLMRWSFARFRQEKPISSESYVSYGRPAIGASILVYL